MTLLVRVVGLLGERGIACALIGAEALADLVRVSRIDEPDAVLLSPEQTVFLREPQTALAQCAVESVIPSGCGFSC